MREDEKKIEAARAIGAAQAAEGEALGLQFPVSFDLRIIYVLEGGASIVEDLQRIYAAQGVSCSLIQGVSKPGAKYGKMGSRLRFETREQMYATYAAIAKLPYVKTAI
jgi:hypothetical protein